MDAFEKAFARLLVEAMGHEDAARDAYLRAAEFAADPDMQTMLTDLANRSLDHHDIIEEKMNELHLSSGDVTQ